MIDVTVKTLDSQNHAFKVEEEITVRQFKEQISPTIAIPVDQQRLIFRGRVLQDDKKISEYNVANNTVHVVQRPANQNSTANDEPPARPNSQAGGRLGDAGGILISAEDGAGGTVGRNAIIMGAIGLPTFDVDGGLGNDLMGMGTGQPRRSGAQVRLMVGNQMLNRASTLLQQLEDDDAAVAAAATAAESPSSSTSGSGDQNSPGNDLADEFLNGDSPMEVDDALSLERIMSNVPSSAALVAAIRQVQDGGTNPPSEQPSSSTPAPSAPPSQPGPEGETTTAPTQPQTAPPNGNSSATSNNQRSRGRRPESPRIRELSTALQDYLALQDRLTPFLRFLQDALRQNRAFTETGESQSTQFVFDTVSSILHLLGHSLHAFSDIVCDFSLPPDDRRLTASSSILVEQSTVVRATIPVSVPTAAMFANAAAAAGAGMAVPGSGGINTTGQQPQQPGSGLPPGISFSMGPSPAAGSGGGSNPYNPFAGIPGLAISMSATPQNFDVPFTFPGFPPAGNAQRPWANPNARGSNSNASGQQPQAPPPPSNNQSGQPPQQQQQQQNNQMPNMGMLPPGLQNLGALLGVGGAGGLANIIGAAGVMNVGGAGVVGMGNPFFNLQQQPGSNNNNNNNVSNNNNPANQPPTSAANPSGGAPTTAGAQPATANGSGSGGSGATGANNNAHGGMGAAAFQNMLRNELTRPQFDVLLPCHTHHTSGRSRNQNRQRPAEFRRFVNVEEPCAQSVGAAEGESVEILIDLFRNSNLIDLIQPMIKDVVLNYLMRGRDAKNPAHVKTCAKGLVKKILPFVEKFSSKVGGVNETVDISATYSAILTGFVTSIMQKVLANGDGQLKMHLVKSLNDLQKKLIHAFKVCYPASTNVGLLFVNYIVEQCLGGTSIIFKNHVRQKLIDHMKHLELNLDGSVTPSFIVYKEGTSTPSDSSGNNSCLPATNAASASSLLSSRCAASFGGNTPSSSSSTSGIATEASSSGGSTPSKVPCTLPTPPPPPSTNSMSDDVDIDEVLQLPASMTAAAQQPQGDAGARRCLGGANAQGHSNNQTDSLASVLRSLPTEWTDTVQQDVRRQVDMPSQQAFSPGYNTLFPRKH